MLFEQIGKIVSKDKKVTTDLFIGGHNLSDGVIKDVMSNIFDGVYNREEIIVTINEIKRIQKIDFGYVKSLFDSIGLSDWYYQDINGGFKIKSVGFVIKLELNTSTNFDTVVISDTHRTPNTPSNKDVGNVMKRIRDKFKNFLKDFNNGEKQNR